MCCAVVTEWTSLDGTRTFNADLSRWQTSRVTTMDYAFHGVHMFNSDLNRCVRASHQAHTMPACHVMPCPHATLSLATCFQHTRYVPHAITCTLCLCGVTKNKHCP